MFSKSSMHIIVKISVLNKAWLLLTEDKGGGWGQETRGRRGGLKPANSKTDSRSSKNRRLTLRIYFKMFYVNETLWDHHWIRVHPQTPKNDCYLFFLKKGLKVEPKCERHKHHRADFTGVPGSLQWQVTLDNNIKVNECVCVFVYSLCVWPQSFTFTA